MNTYKIKTKIKRNQKLTIENLPFKTGEDVEVTITSVTDISIKEIMKFEETGGALDFLNDERENIYTVSDLKVKYK